MESLRQIFNTVQSVSKAIIALCMIAMMVVIFAQTSTRYLIFYSIPWSEEVSRYLYVALTLLGLNLAITSKQLVRIDIIDNYLKGSSLKALTVLRNALTVAITVIFFYSSFGMIDVSQFQSSPALGMSMQIMYSIIGIGFLLSAVAAIFELYDALKADFDTKSEA
jgi:TRAP-type C4-dicarboxylate transport system permease small subunit